MVKGSRVRAWQEAESVDAPPARSVMGVNAVSPWRISMRNQWMMANGVKRQVRQR